MIFFRRLLEFRPAFLCAKIVRRAFPPDARRSFTFDTHATNGINRHRSQFFELSSSSHNTRAARAPPEIADRLS